MTEFHLITGFLGSGKTTLLKNILKEYSQVNRIAVIQNEFAPGGFDGKELVNTGSDFKLVEINNGSVFCVCRLGNFIESMLRLLQEYKPEMIFLEASGLADPVNIIELLQSEGLQGKIILSKIIAIADAVNFVRGLKTFTRFKHQIMIADLILVNKTDIFSGDMIQLDDEIRRFNPYADIFHTAYCNMDMHKLVSAVKTDHPGAKRFTGKESEGRPEMKVSVLRTGEKMKADKLNAFMDEIQDICERIKGYVHLDDGRVVALQTIYNHRNVEEVDKYIGLTELIIFSNILNVKDLRAIMKKYSS